MTSSSLRRAILFVLAVSLAGGSALAACGDAGERGADVDTDAAAVPAPIDGSGTDAPREVPSATMRLAHLARGIGAIDFCYQGARAGTAVGPVLRAAADGGAADAGAALVHDEVSGYVALEIAGPMSLAIVPGGATSCNAPLALADVTLDPGKLATVVLFGRNVDGGPPPLVAFVDDPSPSSGKARVRMVHGADGAGALAVRVASSATSLLAERLEPRRASSASATVPVDVLGYASIAAVPDPASLAVDRLDGGAGWQSAPRDLALVAGSVHTGFVVDEGPSAIAVVWCDDDRAAGDRTTCLVLR